VFPKITELICYNIMYLCLKSMENC